METNTLTATEKFFYDNAGCSYIPAMETREQGQIRTARSLAAAEAWLQNRQDVSYTTQPDDDADLSWMDEEERAQEHEVMGVVLLTPDGDVDYGHALWGIVDPTDDYLRVVAAELALEAMHEAQEAETAAIEAHKYAVV